MSNDIPNIISLIEKLYQILYSLKDVKIKKEKIAEIFSNILKILFHYMILEKKIEINNDCENIFLENIKIFLN